MATYRNLDKSPRIFFLPADQAIPWAIISLIMFLIFGAALKLPSHWVWAACIWGNITWWLLTWNGLYPFFSKWINPPKVVRAIIPYEPILNSQSWQKSDQRNLKRRMGQRKP